MVQANLQRLIDLVWLRNISHADLMLLTAEKVEHKILQYQAGLEAYTSGKNEADDNENVKDFRQMLLDYGNTTDTETKVQAHITANTESRERFYVQGKEFLLAYQGIESDLKNEKTTLSWGDAGNGFWIVPVR